MLKNRSLVFLAAAALVGCGGSSGSHPASRSGSFKVSLKWPAISRLVPQATNTVVVSIFPTGSPTAVDSITFLRSETGSGGGAVTKTNSKTLAEGSYRLEAKAFASSDLSGSPIAVGSTLNIQVVGGGTTPATITMASALTQLRVKLTDLTTGAVVGDAGGYLISTGAFVGTPPTLPAGDQIGFEAVPAADGSVAGSSAGDLVLLPTGATGLGTGIFSVTPTGGLRVDAPDNALTSGHTVLKGTVVGTVFAASTSAQALTFNYLEPTPNKQFNLSVQVGAFAPTLPPTHIIRAGVAGTEFTAVNSVAVVADASPSTTVWAITTQGPVTATTLTKIQSPFTSTSVIPLLTPTKANLASGGVFLGYQSDASTIISLDPALGTPLDNVSTPRTVTYLASSDYDEDLSSATVNQRLYVANVNVKALKIDAINPPANNLTVSPVASFNTDETTIDFAIGRNSLTGTRTIYTVEQNGSSFFAQQYTTPDGTTYTRSTGSGGFGGNAVTSASGQKPVAIATMGDMVWVGYSTDQTLRLLDSTGTKKAEVALTGFPAGSTNVKVTGLSVSGRRVAVAYTYVNGGNFAGIATFAY